jgi:hypothetical protein
MRFTDIIRTDEEHERGLGKLGKVHLDILLALKQVELCEQIVDHLVNYRFTEARGLAEKVKALEG